MTLTESEFEAQAFDDPYAMMNSDALEYVADMEIIPVDANSDNELNEDMSWGERHIGMGSVLSITDYGRHRENCENMAEFREMVREKIRNDMGRQFLKVMDDNKERVTDTLVAISRSNGYVVVPHFE